MIRPLLEVWRREIESFAEEREISYLLDSSNLRKNYLRNRLRLNLIPLIEKEYQPNFKNIVLKTSVNLREENDYLERGAEEAYQRIVSEGKDALSFKFSEYRSLHPAIQWRIVQNMIEKMDSGETVMEERGGAEAAQVYKKLHQRLPSFFIELPHGIFLEKRYDLVLMKRGGTKSVPPFEVELISPGRNYVEEIEKEVMIEETNRNDQLDNFYGVSDIAFLDYQTLHFPLKMRNFRPGDRFEPLGVKGTQKLKEFFIDHKIPRFERPSIPLLTSGEMIAWVVGYRIDERVKVTEKTQRVLKVRVL